MKYIYELSNDQIIALLRGAVQNVGILRNGNQIVKTDQKLDGVPALSEVPAEVEEYALQRKAADLKIRAPQSVTIKQARLALIEAGLFEHIEQVIENETDVKLKQTLKTEWEYMLHLERDNALLSKVAKKVGISDMQIDELFIRAAEL